MIESTLVLSDARVAGSGSSNGAASVGTELDSGRGRGDGGGGGGGGTLLPALLLSSLLPLEPEVEDWSSAKSGVCRRRTLLMIMDLPTGVSVKP